VSFGATWEEVFARISKRPPPKTYGIAFTPRSGSTWISDVVRQSRALGSPGEYFNINAAFDSISLAACTSLEDYYAWLSRVRQTNGVFGFEISWPWLDLLGKEGKLQLLQGVDYWFLLRRRDFVLQAVSLYLASTSGVFHLRDEGEQGARQRVEPGDVEYDAEDIAESVLQVMHGEFLLARHFRTHDTEPQPLWYEDLIEQGPKDFLYRFAEQISVALSPEDRERIDAIQPSLRKSGGERNAEFAERFRAERPAFVAHWEEYRGRMGAAAYRATLADAGASAAPDTVADR
jgi:LPS sulfotransferase NodH